MSPGEIQRMNNLEQKLSSLDFWKEKYNNINTKYYKQKDKYDHSVSLKDLNHHFKDYKKRNSINSSYSIFRTNS